MTVLGGGSGATAYINGDGSSELTIMAFVNNFAGLSGDGLGSTGVFLGNISDAEVDAGLASVLFMYTTFAFEADYTPIGADEGVVSFPGLETLFDVFDLTAPLAFDEGGPQNVLKVFAHRGRHGVRRDSAE